MSNPSAPGNRQRRRTRRKRSPLDEQAHRAIRELRRLGQMAVEKEGVHPDDPMPTPALQLQISVPLGRHAPGGALGAAARSLARDVRSKVDDALRSHMAFRLGRVYCFLCESCDCVHATPSDRRDVFIGYTPTGKPEWQTFTNLCLALGDPRVDRLYVDDPEIIAVVQLADGLTGDLLFGFGRQSGAYNVLGQVTLGLVPANLQPTKRPSSEARVALSLQVVEARSGDEDARLRLNLIGLSMDEITEAVRGNRGPAEGLRRTLRSARDRVESIGRRLREAEQRGQSVDSADEVGPLLMQLRGDLERIFRSKQRRTEHAHERHLAGARPTSHAIRDALNSPPERLYADVTKDTIVVVAAKGRIHVFTEAGKLVTSLTLERGDVERRTESQRWQPLQSNRAEAFFDVLRDRN